MLVFAHLRKCAGTSVVKAALDAGVVLPPGHVNGHPRGPDGHALAGLSTMSADEVGAVVRPLVVLGVQLLAIEWDFPRIEAFPDPNSLAFFTIFRDPVERFLSNYAYDVTRRFTASRTIWDYGRGPAIWQCGNYYTRFFAGLKASDPVRPRDVDYVQGVLTSRFKWATFGDDLSTFLRDDVGLPIRALRRDNATGVVRRLLDRSHLDVSAADAAEIRRLNAEDYALLEALGNWRSTSGTRVVSDGDRARTTPAPS